MPRRNLNAIILVVVLSAICFARVDHGLYAAKLRQIMNYIHDRGLYPSERRNLFEAAAQAMAESIDDENTRFEPAQDRDEINDELNQEFGGVGAVLGVRDNRPQIRHVLLDGPAAKAGVAPEDIVLAVDGEDTMEFIEWNERFERDVLDLKRFTNKVKGPAGTIVRLTIERIGEDDPIEIAVTRGRVPLESVVGYKRSADGVWDYSIPDAPHIAYLRIKDRFGKKTNDELIDALAMVEEEGFDGVVIDLRGNPGGLLDAATMICNLFLPNDKVIVKTLNRKKDVTRMEMSDGSGPYQNIPLAVLINKHSASASEIVAGCLKDHGRAIVVGERSFGKGTVQQLFDVDAGRSMLRLTTASWATPSKRNIHRSKKNGGEHRYDADMAAEWGILPNEGFEVVLDDNDISRLDRHMEQLSWNAIDARYAPPKPPDSKEPPASEEKPRSDDLSGELQDSPDSGDEAPGSDASEESDESKKPPPDGPFVDTQLQRAIEAVRQQIGEMPATKAA